MSKPLVLITGATGHLGFRALVLALQAGYQTRVAIRKPEQSEKILSTASVKPYTHDVSFVTVPDISVHDAYDQAIEGVEYVIHVASPMPLKAENQKGSWNDIYYKPAIDGTLSMLKAAMKTLSVKRVVITSSGSVLPVRDSPPVGPHEVKPAPTLQEAEEVQNAPMAYATSKALSLDAAKRFMEENKESVSFDTAFVIPGFIQGRNELFSTEAEIYTTTNEGTLKAVTGNPTTYTKVTSQVWLDDAARAHVVALSSTKVVNGDILLIVGQGGGGVPWNEVGKIAGEMFPEAVQKGILKPVEGQQSLEWNLDVKSSEEKLGFKFAGPEVWIRETVGWWLNICGHEAE